MSALGDLIELFSKLPNLGPRSARRIVLYLLKNKEKIIPKVITSLEELKSSLTYCENCGNVDNSSPCSICNSDKRKSEKICVVEDIGDLWAIEKSRAYDGHYHVLGGVLSAIDGIGPDELNISSLLKKVQSKKINEIILATNATVEGQITAQFIADSCEKNQIFARLAADLVYVQQCTCRFFGLFFSCHSVSGGKILILSKIDLFS